MTEAKQKLTQQIEQIEDEAMIEKIRLYIMELIPRKAEQTFSEVACKDSAKEHHKSKTGARGL